MTDMFGTPAAVRLQHSLSHLSECLAAQMGKKLASRVSQLTALKWHKHSSKVRRCMRRQVRGPEAGFSGFRPLP